MFPNLSCFPVFPFLLFFPFALLEVFGRDTWCRNKRIGTTERSPPGRPSRMMTTMACRKKVKTSRMPRMVSD